MQLPQIETLRPSWPALSLDGWQRCRRRIARLAKQAGRGDAFERACLWLLGEAGLTDADAPPAPGSLSGLGIQQAASGEYPQIAQALQSRLMARALTHLWLTHPEFRQATLGAAMLDRLREAQWPRLSLLSFQNLLQLYFMQFDRLDALPGSRQGTGLRLRLEGFLREQAGKQRPGTPPPRGPLSLLDTLGRHGHLLLDIDGPSRLAEQARAEGRPLETLLREMGLEAVLKGRHAQLCRAHYYLDPLRKLPPGASDPILTALADPRVHALPYRDGQRVGHAALAILIDRTRGAPGDAWLNLIVGIAGSPRADRNSKLYRDWWAVLGEARRRKVASWLTRQDLGIFLRALTLWREQGQSPEESRARQTFLEGLQAQGLIRHSRLMLGEQARHWLEGKLEPEVLRETAMLDGPNLRDKAVIYLDCGDFHLIEGSHELRLWVYLACPSRLLRATRQMRFTQEMLTREFPLEYAHRHPELAWTTCPHHESWQRQIIGFLADNGIGLDLGRVLSPEDRRQYLARYGEPLIRDSRQQR